MRSTRIFNIYIVNTPEVVFKYFEIMIILYFWVKFHNIKLDLHIYSNEENRIVGQKHFKTL